MTRRLPDPLRELYGATLRTVLVDGEESDAALAEAYNVGRAAVDRELGLLEFLGLHETALAEALDDLPDARVARSKVTAVLAEALSPFDMVLRGYRESTAALRLAREEADRANQAKSEFLSRMSHELRTPLNAILGFGQLLELERLSPPQRDSVDYILNAGRHLLELINEVLDLARVESGQLHTSLEAVALDAVVTEALEMIAPLAGPQDVRLANELPAEDPAWVRADRQRLKQVVLNLLANAVKYNREGGAVRVFSTRTPAGRLRLHVADTGIGIAEQDLTRVFAPFERLATEGREVQGTGLGLALTERVVEAMGGEIGAESKLGRGSTFWVEFDTAEPPTEEPRAPDRPASSDTSRATTAVARTVLYVEDNLSNVRLVERILAHRPEVTLVTAMQGSLGLELARRHRPDLILLDLGLPDTPGEEILRLLRADPRTASIPIVVVSADATAGQTARLRAKGASDYLTKPLEVVRLLEVIDTVGTRRGDARRRPAGITHGRTRGSAAPAAPSTPAIASNEGELDPVQVSALRELLPGGSALRSLAEGVLREAADGIESIAEGARESDLQRARDAAHKLKGSAGVVGARRLMAAAEAIEEQAQAGALPAADTVSELREALVATEDALARVLDDTAPT